MELYIFTVSFWTAELTCEYDVIKGVYDCKETAIEEAKKQIKSQKALWPDSYIRKLETNKVALCSTTGISKVYTIQKKNLNQTY